MYLCVLTTYPNEALETLQFYESEGLVLSVQKDAVTFPLCERRFVVRLAWALLPYKDHIDLEITGFPYVQDFVFLHRIFRRLGYHLSGETSENTRLIIEKDDES